MKWEYLVCKLNPKKLSSEVMTAIGDDGWELVAVDMPFAFFKRQNGMVRSGD